MEKEKGNALTSQYKKRKGSFLGGDVDVESLSPMKFESESPVKKRTPEEIEAARLALTRQKPQAAGPSLMERAKETASAIYEIDATRRAGDVKRLGKAMKSDYKGF